MAILNGNVIGNMRGRLGNLSARTVDGKTIMSARPSSFNVNNDPAVTEVRQKFSVTVALAKSILTLATLAAIWKTVKESGMTVFNTIFKSNFQYSGTDKPTVDNIITPGGFSLPVNVAAVAADKVTVSLLALNTESVFSAEEVNLSANAVVCFTYPSNPDDEPYQIISLNKEVANFDFTQAYDLQIDFDAKQKLIAAKYTKNILLLMVASKTADGKVVQYSSTSPKASV
ncbi:MAG: hypothetical protein M1480_12945 [Bacteroidetes bacterium]|nr:hypothetical protein [Bacteroidota bacterium]